MGCRIVRVFGVDGEVAVGVGRLPFELIVSGEGFRRDEATGDFLGVDGTDCTILIDGSFSCGMSNG